MISIRIYSLNPTKLIIRSWEAKKKQLIHYIMNTQIILSGITIEQFKSIITDTVKHEIANLSFNRTFTNENDTPTETKYIYSIKGLAHFLACSPTTAQSLKNKGVIPYRQAANSRKLIFIESEILEAMAQNGIKKLITTSKS